jgi:DNA invertase Pin-like site-specific DNA recombinase
MRIGYARTSTADQQAGLQAQLRDLEALGCERVFIEHVSGAKAARPQLDALLSFIREGDEVCVTKVDRLARSVRDLLDIVERTKASGAAVEIGGLGRINGSPTSALILHVLAAIAQFEREMMLDRQREGIEAARRDGKYKGRKPTARAKRDEVMRLLAEGVSKAAIARRLGIGEASVYRILADAKH